MTMPCTDRVAEFDERALRTGAHGVRMRCGVRDLESGCRCRRQDPAGALVLLAHDLELGDADLADHRETEVRDEQPTDLLLLRLPLRLRDGGRQVETEVLDGETAAVQEADGGIEDGALFGHALILTGAANPAEGFPAMGHRYPAMTMGFRRLDG